MATFSQYFKVCKEEAEAIAADAPVEAGESPEEVAADVVEANNDFNESCSELEKTETVISDTQEQVDAQKQSLENPESVTPAQVVLAAEAFRANLRLLGIEDGYSKTLSYVNSESVTSSPAQMLSLITVDMEGFLETAKNIARTIWEKIKAIFKWIADLIGKVIGSITGKVKALTNKVEEKLKIDPNATNNVTDGLSGAYPAPVALFKGSNFKTDINTVIDTFARVPATLKTVDTNLLNAGLNGELAKTKAEAKKLGDLLSKALLKYDGKLVSGVTKKSFDVVTLGLGDDEFTFSAEKQEVAEGSVKVPGYFAKPIALKEWGSEVATKFNQAADELTSLKSSVDALVKQAEAMNKETKNEDDDDEDKINNKILLTTVKAYQNVSTGTIKSIDCYVNYVSALLDKTAKTAAKEEKKKDKTA